MVGGPGTGYPSSLLSHILLDVAVLSITGVDVVLPIVPSFATMSLGTHSRQGNTGRPRSEAAKLERVN